VHTGGLEGGCTRVRGQHPLIIFFRLGKRVTYLPQRTCHIYLGGFSAHGFFADGFLFPVKELGFWTNPGHWVRFFDVAGSYMYIVL
jgi:hypothetical protein